MDPVADFGVLVIYSSASDTPSITKDERRCLQRKHTKYIRGRLNHRTLTLIHSKRVIN